MAAALSLCPLMIISSSTDGAGGQSSVDMTELSLLRSDAPLTLEMWRLLITDQYFLVFVYLNCSV